MNTEYEIQNLKEQVANLQNTVIQMARNNTPTISKVDSTANGLSATDGQVKTNTSDIADNTDGLVDLAEVTDENVGSLVDLADIVAELDERVTALEEKE